MGSEFDPDEDLEDLALELEQEYSLEDPTSSELKYAAEQELSDLEEILNNPVKKLEYTALDNPSSTMTYSFATATGALTLATGVNHHTPSIAALGASLIGMGALQFGHLYRESTNDIEEELEEYNDLINEL